jgi:predicted nuclease of predicted toxin-antitoxin system
VSVRLYMDVHVPEAITVGLRLRGADVLTAQEDGARRLADALLLDRATALGRVLVSQDRDLLREAAQRQQRSVTFAGVIYAHQLRVTIGQCVRDLELVAHAGTPEDFANRVEYLPLR